jgi:outer membrane cobalamin receptor
MFKHWLVVVVIFLFAGKAEAGSIKGRATDARSGEVLVGCTVYLPELRSAVSTGLDGSFILRNIPRGKYTLKVSFISYKPLEETITLTGEKDQLSVEFKLEPASIELSEVTITSRQDKSTDHSARSSEHNAANIINVVSSKSIELSPDLNAASVLQRVSGVTIEKSGSGEGQYAILRGMDKRYNYTLVNGIKIPSTDNKYRYLPLNLFPSDLIERLEVTKALTPEMEGDAIGGVINLVMKDAPTDFQFKINAAGGYNQLFADRSFAGFNASVIRSHSPYEAYGDGYNATQNNFSSDNLDVKHKTPLPNFTGGFSVGNRFLNNRLGFMLAGSYQNINKGSNSLFFNNTTALDESNLPVLKSMDNRKFSENQTLYGVHSKLDFRILPGHSLKWYNAFIELDTRQVREVYNIDFSSGYDMQNGTYSQHFTSRTKYNRQQLFTSNLTGEHRFSELLSADWSVVYSKADNQTPDMATVGLVSEVSHNIQQPVYVEQGTCNRRWERNSDKDLSAYLKLNYLPVIAGTTVKITVGGMARDKQRSSFYNNYMFTPAKNYSQQGVDWNSYSGIKWTVSNPPDPTNALNYSATEDIWAGYTQFGFATGKLEWLGGLRGEHTEQGYTLLYEKYGIQSQGSQSYLDILPSLHLKYKIDENNNLRASYYRSLNRPGFLEIVPYTDKTEEYDEGGNSSLKHTTADNYDLRYEYFPKPLEQFMVGAFYKRISNPIEYAFIIADTHANLRYTPENFGTATNYGLEADVIKFFRNVGIKANYTYTQSSITTTKLLRVRNSSGEMETTNVNQTRPLYGQSKHMANLSLLYKNTRYGWDAQLASSYTGAHIAVVSPFPDNDTWEKAAVQIDFSCEKKFGSNFCLFAKVNNLLNTPREWYIKKWNSDYDGYPHQNASSGQTLVRRDYYRQSYLIGIRYSFK